MPSVRTEDDAFGDIRYELLATAAGLADADHARGKMQRLWRQCTAEGTYVLGDADVINVLGVRGADAIISARLGVRVKNGIRIRGTRGRIEWLEKLRSNGRKGGRPKGTKRKPSGSAELNPPALVTALVTAPAPIRDLKIAPSPPAPVATDSDHRAVTDAFQAAYIAQTGGKPTWGVRQGAQVKSLLKAHGRVAVLDRIGRLFDGTIDWLKPPFDLGTLVQHFDKLAPVANAPRAGPAQRPLTGMSAALAASEEFDRRFDR